eukprot:8249002-Pyramimonas_sp.AAC.2
MRAFFVNSECLGTIYNTCVVVVDVDVVAVAIVVCGVVAVVVGVVVVVCACVCARVCVCVCVCACVELYAAWLGKGTAHECAHDEGPTTGAFGGPPCGTTTRVRGELKAPMGYIVLRWGPPWGHEPCHGGRSFSATLARDLHQRSAEHRNCSSKAGGRRSGRGRKEDD